MTPTPVAATLSTSPVPPRALWPIATLGSMILLIVVLTARLVTMSPATTGASSALDGTRALDTTTFATLPSANR